MRRLAVCAASFLLALPLLASGFEFAFPGARSAGLGGACVAAVDPSSVACNPAGMALLAKKKSVSAGVAGTAFNESLYQGLPPGVGVGTAGEQETPLAVIPHAYLTLPLGKTMVLGTGLHTPLRMHTEWTEPDLFAGRFLASSSELVTYDLTQQWAMNFENVVGFGAGITWRSSSFEVNRRVATTRNGVPTEIASLAMKTDTERSLGWNVGLLVRPSARFSVGITHESEIETEYQGVGTLTQRLTGDAQFDQLIAATFPFNQDLPIETSFRFPAQTSAGVTFSPSRPWLFALDVNRTQWARSEGLGFVFPNAHEIDTTYDLDFEDTLSYRGGVRFQFPTGPQVRVGYAVDKTPQPDATIGPFFPDADSTTMTAGFGLDWLDLAVGWTTYKQRIVTTSTTGFNGNFRANSWFAMMSVTK